MPSVASHVDLKLSRKEVIMMRRILALQKLAVGPSLEVIPVDYFSCTSCLITSC